MSVLHTSATLRSHDNLPLFFQQWFPEDNTSPRAHVLIVHGYAEHSGRYRDFAHHLVSEGCHVHALDLRGHGHSGGRRGHCERFIHFLEDVEIALEQIPENAPIFLLGHSHGGLVSLDYAISRQPAIAGLILSNPYLGLSMEVPAAKLLVARLAGQFLPTAAVPSGIDPSGLSHNREVVERYERDPLVFSTATTGWFVAVEQAQARVKAYRSIDLPLLYLFSDCDPIASPHDNRTLSDQLTSPDKTVVVRRGERHEILNEINKEQTYESITQWIRARTS